MRIETMSFKDKHDIYVFNCQRRQALLDETEKLGHTGGVANCKDKAICDTCGEEYGEINADNHKNIVIDVKPKRETENETIAVFQNNLAFQEDYNKLIEEAKTKKEDGSEQLTIDFD